MNYLSVMLFILAIYLCKEIYIILSFPIKHRIESDTFKTIVKKGTDICKAVFLNYKKNNLINISGKNIVKLLKND